MVQIRKALQTAKNKLNENGIDEREARLLLAFALKITPDELIKYTEIDDTVFESFQELLNKRCRHVPFAYITGYKEFMKLNFLVNENVLIPRADTEILVEEAIRICKDELKQKESIKVLDMCTGSGCIAISIAKSVSNASVSAVDISDEALKVAKENAKQNDVSVEFIQSDLFTKLDSQEFDLIVSNPPYIKSDVVSTLEEEVKEHEPILALDGGKDGLDFYKKISKIAKYYLSSNGYLIFEIGFDEAEELQNVLTKDGYNNIRVLKDYSGNDRVVIANK